LTDIKTPVLVLVGELDIPDLHAVADLIKERVASAEKRVVPGVGQLINLESHELFNKTVADFLIG
jgi:pimeloyl-ACP methyl ester carboxylesterase